jgi:hypothetical protein
LEGEVPESGASITANSLCENKLVNRLRFVTDSRGRRVAVLIDLKDQGARFQDFLDGLVSKSRRNEDGIPLAQVRSQLVRSKRLKRSSRRDA